MTGIDRVDVTCACCSDLAGDFQSVRVLPVPVYCVCWWCDKQNKQGAQPKVTWCMGLIQAGQGCITDPPVSMYT